MNSENKTFAIRLQLMKLRKRFKDVVATERIVLHAVESDHVVCGY